LIDALQFTNVGNTLATAGASINFSAGSLLTVCNLNTAGGDVSLIAGTTGSSGPLSAATILTAGSGNITFQATNFAGGTITQTGVASGVAISVTATSTITVDALRGTTVGITSNSGAINSLGSNAVQANTQLNLSAAAGITLNTLTPDITASNSTFNNI